MAERLLGREPRARLEHEQRLDKGARLGGHPAEALPRPVGGELPRLDALLGGALRRAAEGVAAREQHVHEHARGPHVGLGLVRGVVGQHLGRHEVERAARLQP